MKEITVTHREGVMVKVDALDGGVPHEFTLTFSVDEDGVLATIDNNQEWLRPEEHAATLRSWA